MVDIIKLVEQDQLKDKVPPFNVGDSVNVSVRIVEGERKRVQIFAGTVIARKGSGVNEMFTVRRIVGGEGVERVFPLHSPNVVGVRVTRRGKVRRAKLYYLRDRVGKATKTKELIGASLYDEAEKEEKKAKKRGKKARATKSASETAAATAAREKSRKDRKAKRKKAKKAKKAAV